MIKPNRRGFIRTLLATPLAMTLDVEKLLWVPNEKTIIILPPRVPLDISAIISAELRRLEPKLKSVFDRDDCFYQILKG